MSESKKSFIAAIISILIGLGFGLYLLLLTNSTDALAGFAMILVGGFGDGVSGISQLLYTATPIILCGLSVGFAFKTGLFNIGVTGQFTVGAFAAVYVGVKWTFLPAGLHTLVAILAAVLAAALWGAICGILKAFCRVNEVITGIMLNYVALYLVNYLVRNTIYDSSYNGSLAVADTAILRGGLLDRLLPGNSFDVGIIVSVLVVILVYIILRKTVFGYELICCGRNGSAAKYAGVSVKRDIILSITIAGAFAGIGAAMMYLSPYEPHLFVSEATLEQGWTGLSVALLGMSNPFGILAAGLFVANITVGGSQLQLFAYSTEVLNMILGVIVFCGALALPIKIALDNHYKKKEQKKQKKQESSDPPEFSNKTEEVGS